jgi:hypothetical protein
MNHHQDEGCGHADSVEKVVTLAVMGATVATYALRRCPTCNLWLDRSGIVLTQDECDRYGVGSTDPWGDSFGPGYSEDFAHAADCRCSDCRY